MVGRRKRLFRRELAPLLCRCMLVTSDLMGKSEICMNVLRSSFKKSGFDERLVATCASLLLPMSLLGVISNTCGIEGFEML